MSESNSVVKFVALMNKRVGMSTEAFRDYYETHHRLLGEKYLKDNAIKYMRRYATSVSQAESEFDVILEIWYADMEKFQAGMAYLQTPEIAAEIREDEEKLFDRSKMKTYFVEEFESQL